MSIFGVALGLSPTSPFLDGRYMPPVLTQASDSVSPPPSPAPVAADPRDLFEQHPGLVYGDLLHGVPQFFIFDGFASRTFIEQARQDLAGQPGSLEQLLSGFQSSASSAMKDALGRMIDDVTALRSAGVGLLQDSTYQQGRAMTSDGGTLNILATATDGVGSSPTALNVLSLAQAQQVASNPRADAGAALGFRGSFTLNGVSVPVLPTDNLFTLADRINYGEDSNHNGTLDFTQGGVTVPIFPTDNYYTLQNRIKTQHYSNHNGQPDHNEDLNLNFTLDGGTVAHGVEAHVLVGRLVLNNAVPGPAPIRVEDPNGILTALGLVQINYQGDQVFSNPITVPAGASVQKGGTPVSLNGNVSSDLIPGVTLEFRRAGGPITVSVARDDANTVSAVRRFVQAFNGVVGELNGLLEDGGVLAQDPRSQRFLRGLERATQDPLTSPPLPAGAAGLAPVAAQDQSFSELQIRGVLDRLRQGLGGVFDEVHGIPSAAGHLSQLGIKTLQDDTLSLDESALSSALAQDTPGVKKLLADPNQGIAALVDAALTAATDPAVGSLPRFLTALGGRNLTPLAKGIQDFQRTQQFGDLSQLIAVG